MLRGEILSSLYSKRKTYAEFNWDSLFAPNFYCFISEVEIEKLYNISTSIRYAGDVRKKDAAIKAIMEPLGFRRLAAGTNRVVYSYLEDTSFLAKIAIDKTGMKNNPDEYRNQFLLKPFVTKCFQYHPTGVIGTHERIQPITSIEEYLSIWDDVYELILNVIGEYIIEDIGTNFFMNVGIRKNFGPVFCDYPELFKLDGNKLFCNKPIIPGQKFPLCGGLIDYDAGFNFLVCTKCGKQYSARDLSTSIKEKLLILKGEYGDMDVKLVRGNEILVDGRDSGTATIKPPKIQRSRELKVSLGAHDAVEENMETTNEILKMMELSEPEIHPSDNVAQGALESLEETRESVKTFVEEVIPPAVEEIMDLSKEEQNNNRVKPIPPASIDLY